MEAQRQVRLSQVRENLDQQTVELLGGPLDLYAEALLKIKGRKGAIEPFRMNSIQLALEEKLERQRERIGMVRAIVLKARKPGVSTSIAARFFRRAHAVPGTSVYILSHEKTASKTLFGISDRFWTNLPPEYRPTRSRVREGNSMVFSHLDSDYEVGTAMSKATGRSKTFQLFHGSEIAFWRNAEDHFASSVQTVPSEPGTEIVLESTGNGIGGKFYEMWNLALQGKGLYIPIFFPWFALDEYQTEPPAGWRPEEEEAENQALYNLTPAQAYWYHLKNIELGGKPGKIAWYMRQEYPANAQEAFQAGNVDSLISSNIVMRARQFKAPEPANWVPLVMGVDLARGGGDMTRLMTRRGRILGREVNEKYDTDNEMLLVHHIASAIDLHGIDMTFIDITGMGGGVVSRLRELGYGERVMGINFGPGCPQPDKYPTMRAYMWDHLKKWLEDPIGVQIPDDDLVHQHFCGPTFSFDSNSKLVLEKKVDIKKRLKFSPDCGDAAALTFAMPVARRQYSSAVEAALRDQHRADWMTA